MPWVAAPLNARALLVFISLQSPPMTASLKTNAVLNSGGSRAAATLVTPDMAAESMPVIGRADVDRLPLPPFLVIRKVSRGHRPRERANKSR